VPRSLTLLVGAALLLAARPAQAQTTLRYQFKAGDKIPYTMEQKASIKTDVAGKQSNLQIQLTVDWTWHVTAVGNDGKAEVTYKVDRMRSVTDDGGGHKMSVDSDDDKTMTTPQDKAAFKVMKDKGITMNVDPLGRVDNVQFPPELLEQFRQNKDVPVDELVRQLFMPVALVLPKEAVNKGQGWHAKPFEGNVGVGRLTIQTAFTDQGLVQQGGKTLEQIAVKPTLSVEKADAKQGEKVESQGEGTILFDNGAGRIVATSLTLNAATSLDAGNGMTVKMTTRETRTLTIRPAK
jgi:hypothetical protein